MGINITSPVHFLLAIVQNVAPSPTPTIDGSTDGEIVAQFWISVIGALVGALSGGIISAIIARSSFANEREAAANDLHASREQTAADRYAERRMGAAESVLLALTPLVSFNPSADDQAPMLRELRVRLVLYQVVLRDEDVLSADWLFLEWREGMSLYIEGFRKVKHGTLEQRQNEFWINEQFEIARTWANDVMTLFAGWLRGSIPDQVLKNRGASHLEKFPEMRDAGTWEDIAKVGKAPRFHPPADF